MKKIFGNLNMSFLTVILFAIITGVYTGFIMTVEPLYNTSFQDIGVMYEWWVVFAVIVVVNCKKNYEAALKCFVFFLISQPVIYGIEILLGHISFDDAKRFYFSYWFFMTLLTLPGGFIAYYCKKDNIFGAIVLGLGNTLEGMMCAWYIRQCIASFPHHLLSAIFCLASIFVMTFTIQSTKRNRIIALVTPFIAVLLLIIVCKILGLSFVL